MSTDTDPRVAEAMRLAFALSTADQEYALLHEQGAGTEALTEASGASNSAGAALSAYLAAEFAKVPSAPVEAVPDSRQNCRNFTAGKDGECVHCYAKAGQECQYEPASDDALSDRYVEQRNEIARLTAELADEKAVVDVLRSELQDRLQKQRAAEAELQEVQEVRKDAGRYQWLRDKHPADERGMWVCLGRPEIGISCWRNEALDEFIDAAMTKEKPYGRPE